MSAAPVDDIPWPDEAPPDHIDQGANRTLISLDEVDYVENAIRQRMGVMRIDRQARRRLDDEDRPPVLPPPVKSLDTLLAEPDTPTRYRIEGIAPVGGRVMLSAQFKAGKTTIVGNLLRSLVDADPFLGRFTVHAPARQAVLIDNELSQDTLRRWLRNQNITNTDAVADVVELRGGITAFNLLDDRCRARWASRLRDSGCDYLILDCLRPILDALGLDENHDAGQFLVAFDALLADAGINDALIVQHMGHANERARGDSRLQDWPDAIWRLVRETEEPGSPRYFTAYGRDVDVPEGRLGFDPVTRRLSYAEGSRANAKTEAAVRAVIGALAANATAAEPEPMSVRNIQAALDGQHPREATRAAIKQAIEDGLVTFDKGPRGAQLHRIAHPCTECGLPVTSKRPRHESCAPPGDEGLLE